MPHPFFLVDAFAHAPFTGNPAGVVLLDAEADAEWMQRVGMEVHQAETAFVWPLGGGRFGLRWFTPTVEVDLCGHATLASAFALWHAGRVPPTEAIRFETKSGELVCTRLDDGRIELDFPAETPHAESDAAVAALVPGATFLGANRMDWFAELPTEADVLAYQPDFAAIDALGMRGLLLTARAEREGVDFVSRFFAPQSGVDEDFVTGSAHCALAPYWAEKLGRTALTGFQASSRGGFVGVELRGERVALRGHAKLAIEGQLLA